MQKVLLLLTAFLLLLQGAAQAGAMAQRAAQAAADRVTNTVMTQLEPRINDMAERAPVPPAAKEEMKRQLTEAARRIVNQEVQGAMGGRLPNPAAIVNKVMGELTTISANIAASAAGGQPASQPSGAQQNAPTPQDNRQMQDRMQQQIQGTPATAQAPAPPPRHAPPPPASAIPLEQRPIIATYVTGHGDPAVNRVLGIDMTQLLVRTHRYRIAPRKDEFMIAAENQRVRGGGNIDESRILELARNHDISRVCITTVTPVLGSYYITAKIVNVETGATVRRGELDNSLASLHEIKRASERLVSEITGQEATRGIPPPHTAQASAPQQQPQVQSMQEIYTGVAQNVPRAEPARPAHTQHDVREATSMVGLDQTAPVRQTQHQGRPAHAQPRPTQPANDYQTSDGRTRAGLRFALNMAIANARIYDGGSSWNYSHIKTNDDLGYGFESGLLLNTELSERWAFNYGANIIWSRTPVNTQYYKASEGAIAIPAMFRLKRRTVFTYSGFQLDFPISDIEKRNAVSFDWIYGFGVRAGDNVEFDIRAIRSFGFVNMSSQRNVHMEQLTLGFTYIFGN